MTDAALGYGTTWSINGTEVAEVTEVTPGETTADRVEATHMKSPGRRREYIAGLIDNGEASFSINWVPNSGTDVLIRDLLTSGATAEHIITFPNDVTVTFDGAITGFSKAIPIDDRMTATVTVATSGDEVWSS